MYVKVNKPMEHFPDGRTLEEIIAAGNEASARLAIVSEKAQLANVILSSGAEITKQDVALFIDNNNLSGNSAYYLELRQLVTDSLNIARMQTSILAAFIKNENHKIGLLKKLCMAYVPDEVIKI
jgi:predicted nucleotidyltransferase